MEMSETFGINRAEAVVIVGVALFSAFWVLVVDVYLMSAVWFISLTPLVAYFMYNAGFIAVATLVFGVGIDYLKQNEVNIAHALVYGFASWFVCSFVFDVWEPPYFVSPSGATIIPLGTNNLANTAADAFLTTLWRSLMGNAVDTQIFGISSLFILVYVVSPILTLIVMAVVLLPEEFLDVIQKG